MNYLLDTDVIINHINQKESFTRLITEENSLFTSVIVYAELLYGIKKSYNPKSNLIFLENLFDDLEILKLDITTDIIDVFVDLKLHLESRGERLDDNDLLIAATAIQYDSILITNNKKHFSRIPNLKLQ
jgi:tRNA(fMet)-specific endonuclease VapC